MKNVKLTNEESLRFCKQFIIRASNIEILNLVWNTEIIDLIQKTFPYEIDGNLYYNSSKATFLNRLENKDNYLVDNLSIIIFEILRESLTKFEIFVFFMKYSAYEILRFNTFVPFIPEDVVKEIRSIFQKNLNYTVVEVIATNTDKGNNCYILENSFGGLMVDNSEDDEKVAVAFSINELTSIYNTEVNNNTLEFYKD